MWLGAMLAWTPSLAFLAIVSLPTVSSFSWRWEIRRHSRPMGVKLGAGGYQSQDAAEFTGNRALDEFLIELFKEVRRRR
jgi:hypothetical protein